ncbi:MAG: CDP-alcohol phosphatidyltransferase family protein [Candidatus Stahlbacteria bacterium]|nr:CDP-alcohol phosphatidyltransferase family protein [Candidatus Stahlbacteria bacterium]
MRKWIVPLVKLLSGVNPDLITVLGFIITCIAGVYYKEGIFWLAGIILLVGGIFDILDGEIARITNKTSKAGAFLDSCLDRCSDFVIFFGMFLWYLKSNNTSASILAVLAIGGSFLVPYARARAESLGQTCKSGFADRGIRIPIIIIGSLLGARVFVYFLWLLVITTIWTGIYRIVWARKKLE